MANQFFVPTPNYGQGLQSLAQGVQQFGQQQREEQRRQEAEAYKQRAKQAMSEAFQSGDPRAIRQAVIQYPEIAETATQMFGFTNDQTEQVARETYRRALSETDPQRRAAIMEGGIETVQQFGGNPRMMARDLQMLQENPEAALRSMQGGYAALASDQEFEAMFPGAGGSGLPAQTQAFNALVEASKSEDPTVRQAARVELGLEPRAGTLSAEQRTALDDFLKGKVVELERETTAAREEGKLETQATLLPEIRANVKRAEQEAESRGEALSEYGRAQAAMPGLREVVNKLKTLSDVATYTMGGKVFDTVIKELGFGATEGATARAKMESLVNNQILPLLRDTFGAQFTEREGEQLRKTMLDIDAAPEQKKQILDSFIEQKMRDLEMKQRRAGETPASPEIQPDESGEQTVNWSDL